MNIKFGDCVLDTKGKVDREDNPYDYYIAGDHMDSEDLELHRRGSFATDDVGPAFVRIFKPGQVLYGSRRTYLKKVAVADFEGVTANTTFVFESKNPDVLSQELLPFIMLSDKFTNYSILKSKGSTNPYVLFSDLADYEFDLPDIEAQRKLAEVLWSMEYTKRAYRKLIQQTDELVKSQFIEMFGNPIAKEKDDTLPMLGDVCILKAGKFVKADSIKEKQEDGLFPCFGGNGIRGYVPSFNQDGEFPLIGRQGALCGNVQYAVGQFHATEHAVVVTPKDEMNRFWLYHLLLLLDLNRYASGAAQPGLAVNKLEAIRIEVPELKFQNWYSQFAKQSDKSKFELNQSLAEITAMQKRIINQNLV